MSDTLTYDTAGLFRYGDKVLVPTSELGQKYGKGTVMEVYSNVVSVDFVTDSGTKVRGVYSIHRHKIEKVG